MVGGGETEKSPILNLLKVHITKYNFRSCKVSGWQKRANLIIQGLHQTFPWALLKFGRIIKYILAEMKTTILK